MERSRGSIGMDYAISDGALRLPARSDLPKMTIEGHACVFAIERFDCINDFVTNWLLQILGCVAHHLCDWTNLNQSLDNIGKAHPAPKGQWLL